MSDEPLEIPTFLRKGTPENLKAIAVGREVISRRPKVSRRPTSQPWANTGYREPPKKYKCTESTFFILKSLGWTDKVINRLSLRAANQYADGGVKMQPTHEVEK
jgi:hypothetical protein